MDGLAGQYSQREAGLFDRGDRRPRRSLNATQERNRALKLILDTTGSVIYTGNNVLMRLRRQMTVVYLAASAEEQQLLMRQIDGPEAGLVARRVSG